MNNDDRNATTLQEYEHRLHLACRYIEEHLDEPLALDMLAEQAHFSPYHFHRIFTGMRGESVAEHIRRLRLERAASRLRQTGQSVLQLALEAGYDSHEAFTRAFKAQFGTTPSAWRRADRDTLMRQAGTMAGPRRIPLSQKELKEMKVEIRKIPAQEVVYVRHTGPYQDCKSAWDKLCGWACPKGLFNQQTEILGVCYDDPDVTPADKIRYDACLSVVGEVVESRGVCRQQLPAGLYACYLHKGPYNTLKEAYARLCGEWIPASGYAIRNAPSVERYLNSPDQTPEAELLTEIRIPVAK